MKKAIYCSVVIGALVYGASSEDMEKFNQRYMNQNRLGVSESRNINFSSMKTTDIQTQDLNVTAYVQKNNISNYGKTNNDQGAIDAARSISDNTKSKAFQKTVGKNEQYIINDKQLDWSKYLGNYKASTTKLAKQMQEEGTAYVSKNEVLGQKERVLVVISSSMPDELVRSYFEAFQSVNHDVAFVMRGMVGGATKYRPTAEYISRVMSKDPKKDINDQKNKYVFDVSINPKITERFNITKVPAIIYVDNYDPIAELQTAGRPVNDDENYWVAYGDMEPKYAIERINQSARKESLKHLIARMNKGFYSEGRLKK